MCFINALKSWALVLIKLQFYQCVSNRIPHLHKVVFTFQLISVKTTELLKWIISCSHRPCSPPPPISLMFPLNWVSKSSHMQDENCFSRACGSRIHWERDWTQSFDFSQPYTKSLSFCFASFSHSELQAAAIAHWQTQYMHTGLPKDRLSRRNPLTAADSPTSPWGHRWTRGTPSANTDTFLAPERRRELGFGVITDHENLTLLGIRRWK